MRLGSWLLLGSIALGVSAHGCDYPDFHFRPKGDGTGASTSVGGNGVGGSGLGTGATATGTGAGVGAGGAGAGTTSTGVGASGGGGGAPPCNLYVFGACGPGKKCSVIHEPSGATGCVDAGPRPATAYCNFDVECEEGTWCDHTTQVCKAICQSGNQCVQGANCEPAPAAGGGTFPGLQLCTSYCDPINPQACSQAFGTTNCIAIGTGFDCYASGTQGELQDCNSSLDCGPGLVCVTVLFTWCRRWCDLQNDNCGPVMTCTGFTPPVFYNGSEYGACVTG